MSSPRWRTCPDCRAFLQPGVTSCEYCGTRLDSAIEVRRDQPSSNASPWALTPVCTSVAILLLAIYAAQLVLQITFYDEKPEIRGLFGMFAPSHRAQVLFTGRAGSDADALTNFCSNILSNLVHGGLIHVGFNLSAFAVLGRRIEYLLGSAFTLFLIAMGSLALVVAPMLQEGDHIGFSGVVCAFLGAVLIHARASGDVMMTHLAKHWTITMAIWSLLPGVSWAGHLAGFVIGAIVMSIWMAPRVPALRRTLGRRCAASAAVLLFLVCTIKHGAEVVPAFTYRKARLIDLLMERVRREVDVSYGDRAWAVSVEEDVVALGALPSAWNPLREDLLRSLSELSAAERASDARQRSARALIEVTLRWKSDLPQYLNRLSKDLFVEPLAWRRNRG